MFYINF
jgi:sphingolipid delta-4 desaturase